MRGFNSVTGLVFLAVSVSGCGGDAVESDLGVPIEALLQREALEIWTEGNMDVIPLVYADTQLVHAGDQVYRISHDGWRRVLGSWREAFPDLVMEVDEVVISGDRAAARYTLSGTHLGEFEGHAPTGEAFRFEQMYFVRVEDGRIVESWGVWDKYGLYEQLGLLGPGV